MKPKIFKHKGRWVVERPRFGFASTSANYATWEEARDSLISPKIQSHTNGYFDRTYSYSDGIAPVSAWSSVGHYRRHWWL